MREYEYYHSLAAQGRDHDDGDGVDIEAVLDGVERAEREGREVGVGELGLLATTIGGIGQASTSNQRVAVRYEEEEGEIEMKEAEDGDEDEGEVGEEGEVPDVPDVPQTSDTVQGEREPTAGEREAALRRVGVGASQESGQGAPGGGEPKGIDGGQESKEGDSGASGEMGADQLLENVKMAYYWAGYYSGLYDGQRGKDQRGKDQGGGGGGSG